jgi:hypothetical protein
MNTLARTGQPGRCHFGDGRSTAVDRTAESQSSADMSL